MSLYCGFKELYQQMLAKALAHYFEAKLLLLDVNDFSLKVSICHFFLKKKLHTVWIYLIYPSWFLSGPEQIWCFIQRNCKHYGHFFNHILSLFCCFIYWCIFYLYMYIDLQKIHFRNNLGANVRLIWINHVYVSIQTGNKRYLISFRCYCSQFTSLRNCLLQKVVYILSWCLCNKLILVLLVYIWFI